jgi:hypothetical protein
MSEIKLNLNCFEVIVIGSFSILRNEVQGEEYVSAKACNKNDIIE